MSKTRHPRLAGESRNKGEKPLSVEQLQRIFNQCLQATPSAIQTIRKSQKFKQTNRPWNEHYFNSRRSIGALVYLYKQGECQSVQQFQHYYLAQGGCLKKTPTLDPFYHGRTYDQLSDLIQRFKKVLGQRYTLEEVASYVWIRLFFETHEGVCRERQALTQFQTKHPHLTVQESDVEKDFSYGVDAEVFEAGQLLYALQVKSIHYIKDQQAILKKTKHYNHQKHQAYSDIYHVPVYYLVVDGQENHQLIKSSN